MPTGSSRDQVAPASIFNELFFTGCADAGLEAEDIGSCVY